MLCYKVFVFIDPRQENIAKKRNLKRSDYFTQKTSSDLSLNSEKRLTIPIHHFFLKFSSSPMLRNPSLRVSSTNCLTKTNKREKVSLPPSFLQKEAVNPIITRQDKNVFTSFLMVFLSLGGLQHSPRKGESGRRTVPRTWMCPPPWRTSSISRGPSRWSRTCKRLPV